MQPVLLNCMRAIAESWEGSEDVSNGRETVPLLQQTHHHSSQMQHLGVLMNTGPFLKLFPKKDWLGQVEQVVGGVLLRLLVFAVLSTRHSALLQGMTGSVCVLSLTEHGSAVSSTWAMQ